MPNMHELEERVDQRLNRISETPGEVRPATDVSYLCSGTDVPGLELQARLAKDIDFFVRAVTAGADIQETVAGMLIRSFWLGYEFGSEA